MEPRGKASGDAAATLGAGPDGARPLAGRPRAREVSSPAHPVPLV